MWHQEDRNIDALASKKGGVSMAQSRCLKCGGNKFEVVHANNLEGTTRAVLFVQCTECGSVVGVLDFLNVSVKAERVKNDIRIMMERLLDRVNNS